MKSLASNIVVELADKNCGCRFCGSARMVQRLRQISQRLDRASAERNELLCGRLLADQINLMELLLEERGETA